jgi:hypothetical protein
MPDVLSDTRHLVRATDPDTSHAAAAQQTEDKRSALQREIERWALLKPKGFTDWDLPKVWPAIPPSSLRTRRHELTEMGILVDTGKRLGAPGPRNARREAIMWAHRIFVEKANDNASSQEAG